MSRLKHNWTNQESCQGQEWQTCRYGGKELLTGTVFNKTAMCILFFLLFIKNYDISFFVTAFPDT